MRGAIATSGTERSSIASGMKTNSSGRNTVKAAATATAATTPVTKPVTESVSVMSRAAWIAAGSRRPWGP